jgi:hypothetical protein
MQIIDELEVAKRGPYGGGIGHVSFTGAPPFLLSFYIFFLFPAPFAPDF